MDKCNRDKHRSDKRKSESPMHVTGCVFVN